MEDTQNPSAQIANEELLLQQGYCVVPSSERLTVLCSLLKTNYLEKKKVMIFFSSCNSVKFHSKLLPHIIQVDDDYFYYDFHGMQKQQKISNTVLNFRKADKGILLCTDTAARGFEIPPDVDWIVQYEPPVEPKEYIHRVGQLALCEGSKSRNVLLFLTPEELQFCKYLEVIKVPVKECVMVTDRIADGQSNLENLVASNHFLIKSAKAAYKSYILSYKVHSMKNIFNVDRLDIQAVAASFCLSSPPKVNINIESMEEIKGVTQHGFRQNKPWRRNRN